MSTSYVAAKYVQKKPNMATQIEHKCNILQICDRKIWGIYVHLYVTYVVSGTKHVIRSTGQRR